MASRSLPLRLALQYALTLVALWALLRLVPQYVAIDGGPMAVPTVAALLFLLNLFVRPVLRVVTLPLKLFMTLAAIVLVNAAFLWILERIAERLDPSTAVFAVQGGTGGWIVVALLLGIANWIIHHSVR